MTKFCVFLRIFEEPKSKKAKKKEKNVEEAKASTSATEPEVKTKKKEEKSAGVEKKANGLEIQDLRVGTGPEAKLGKPVISGKKKRFFFNLNFVFRSAFITQVD